MAQSDSASPEHLAPTIESPQTPEISELARQLGNDSLKIVEWVQSRVRPEPTFGVFRGAEATLQDLSGNPADQAALLVALLRAAGIPSRFVIGRMSISREMASRWFGHPAALDVIQRSQTPLFKPGDTIHPNPGFTTATVRHFWVEFFAQPIGWIPVDPSFKTVVRPVVPALPGNLAERAKTVLDSARIDDRARSATGISEQAATRIVDELVRVLSHEQLEAFRASLAGTGIESPRFGTLGELQRGFPHRTPEILFRGASVPDELVLKISIRWAGLNVTVPGPSIGNKRVSLFWRPMSEEEGRIIARQGLHGFDFEKHPNLSVRPILYVAGQVRATGSPQPLGTQLPITFSFQYPSGGVSTFPAADLMAAGGFTSIVFNWGGGSSGRFRSLGRELADAARLASDRIPLETVLGSWFHIQGLAEWFLNDSVLRAIEVATGATYLRAPSVMASGYSIFRRSHFLVLGSPYVSRWEGLAIVLASAERNSAFVFRLLSGIFGSNTEGRAFEALYGRRGVAGSDVIRTANVARAPVHVFAPEGVEAGLRSMRAPDLIREWVMSRVRFTKATIVMPSTPLAVEGLQVWGFFEFDETGSSGGLIFPIAAKGGITLNLDWLQAALNALLERVVTWCTQPGLCPSGYETLQQGGDAFVAILLNMTAAWAVSVGYPLEQRWAQVAAYMAIAAILAAVMTPVLAGLSAGSAPATIVILANIVAYYAIRDLTTLLNQQAGSLILR